MEQQDTQSVPLDHSNSDSGHNPPPGLLHRTASVWGVRPWGFKEASKVETKPFNNDMDHLQVEEKHFLSVGNILWVILFGWWLALPYLLSVLLLSITYIGRPYANLCWKLVLYFLWPFGKYVIEKNTKQDSDILAPGEVGFLLQNIKDVPPEPVVQTRKSTSETIAHAIFWLILSLIIIPINLISIALNWFFVVSIPMSKVVLTVTQLLISSPNSMEITNKYHLAQSHTVHLCTYRAFNIMYFDYQFRGINIVFLNLLPLVVIRVGLIIIHFFVPFHIFSPVFQFFIDLVCSIPITFYIGTSISSIASQTSFTIGAILNATFGSITELLLFTIALKKGSFDELILFSLTGSLLSDMLLLPGLSMIIGGMRYKEQHFNPKAAGVSSIMLFIAVIGAFSPTMFYHMFGRFSQECDACSTFTDHHNITKMMCNECHYSQKDMQTDPMFVNGVRYLLYFVASLLPIAYIIGMVFTFKTHKHIFTEEGEEESEAEWSLSFSIIVMLVSIAMFGLIAEDVVSVLQGVLEELGVTQAFLGITLIALAPAATEIANAIKFALLNQISLSIGIGCASSIQVALIQMPALIWIASIANASEPVPTPFPLVFPLLSVFAVILAVFTFNYIAAEGSTNYFIGASLVIIYLCLVSSFYFVPTTATAHSNPE
eukprot:TRINITY_DN2174_c0_g1_i1.p1 TRINITY_DN2174_c0_g1~~TRINITY_DN2174_c0_g1_i1.p1  ORF type:complete len:658 (-),score=76.15 TRINITY_DN2174_c0_g1_i1:268-2241(-)